MEKKGGGGSALNIFSIFYTHHRIPNKHMMTINFDTITNNYEVIYVIKTVMKYHLKKIDTSFHQPLPNMVQRLFADVINDAIWFMNIHLFFLIILSFFLYFNLFVSIFIQSYVNIKLHVTTLYRIACDVDKYLYRVVTCNLMLTQDCMNILYISCESLSISCLMFCQLAFFYTEHSA